MLRMQAAQIGLGRFGGCHAVDDQPRLQQLRPAVEIGAQLRCRMDDAPATRITSVLQDCQREANLGRGDPFMPCGPARASLARRPRQRKVARVETPFAGTPDFGDRRRRFGCEVAGGGQPNGCMVTLSVEGDQRCLLVALLVVGGRLETGESFPQRFRQRVGEQRGDGSDFWRLRSCAEDAVAAPGCWARDGAVASTTTAASARVDPQIIFVAPLDRANISQGASGLHQQTDSRVSRVAPRQQGTRGPN